jgi:hypothetical protein
MTTRRWIPVLLIFLLIPASMASVSVDYDKDKAFADYKTFGWKPGSPARSQLNQERLEASIRAQLESHGMTQSDGEADLYVVTHVSIEGKTRVDVDNFGYGGYWRGYQMSTVHVSNFEVGTLIVDLLDGETNRLVWRSVATKTLPYKQPSPDKTVKKINKIVGKMFKNFPPQ